MFFRRKKQVKEIEQPKPKSIVDAEGYVTTELSFHEDWDLEPQEKYVYRYEHRHLEKIQENQLNIHGIKLIPYDNGFVVVAFLRNTSSQPLHVEDVEIVIEDKNGKSLAKHTFSFNLLGDLPPYSARPWRFLFSEEHTLDPIMPEDGWKVVFQMKETPKKPLHHLDIDPSWYNSLTNERIQFYDEILRSLPESDQPELRVIPVRTELDEHRNLKVTLFIRNFYDYPVTLDQLSLTVLDAQAETICSSIFTLPLVQVNGYSSKPWICVFPSESLQKENIDLSSWNVIIK